MFHSKDAPHLRSLAVQSDSFGPARDQVHERSHPPEKDDDQDPDDLVIALGRLFGRAVYEHPDPEYGAPDAEDSEGATEKEFENARAG
jgi:hypothetical protein